MYFRSSDGFWNAKSMPRFEHEFASSGEEKKSVPEDHFSSNIFLQEGFQNILLALYNYVNG